MYLVITRKNSQQIILPLNNGSVYATPVDSSGMVTPITKYLLNPAEYYKKRSEIKN